MIRILQIFFITISMDFRKVIAFIPISELNNLILFNKRPTSNG
jgi:hypothetical protein